MSEPQLAARSPISPASPSSHSSGWIVSGSRSGAALRLADMTPLAKVLVRAEAADAAPLRCRHGGTRRSGSMLLAGSGPDSWLAFAPAGEGSAVVAALSAELAGSDGLVTVLDVTHAHVTVRLSGERAARVLEKLCAIDLGERTTPDGSCFRSRVAGVVCTVVRDDVDGQRSYLISSDRSSGQYLFDALLDAGREFGIAPTGYPDMEI